MHTADGHALSPGQGCSISSPHMCFQFAATTVTTNSTAALLNAGSVSMRNLINRASRMADNLPALLLMLC